MVEIDALISQYSHLNKLPREKDALQSLKKIASLVKPIMRARNWTVGTLTEFYPDQQNLLGLNVNKGAKICLRLRYPGDNNQFLPLEQVVDTMLHELCHNEIGPHNDQFHALWDQLRKEYEGLLSKGYTGEGFLSNGHRLGGSRVPRDEARRIAAKAADKRRVLSVGSGQKLGGRPVPRGSDIRNVIVDAIERRKTVTKGCGGGGQKGEAEIKALADEATRNGFGTKAEMDEANDRAIAQALWELVQEDEKKTYGESYIPPTPKNPTGNGGGEIKPSSASSFGSGSGFTSGSSSNPNQKPSAIKREAPPPSSPPVLVRSKPRPIREHADRPVSRLVTESSTKPKPKPKPRTPLQTSANTIDLTSSSPSKPPTSTSTSTSAPTSISTPTPKPQAPQDWTCTACTLLNPISYLTCDACTSPRPPEISLQIAATERKQKANAASQADMWVCSRCSTQMENKWWTCMNCGNMKESS